MGYTAAEIGISCLGAICYGVLFALAALAVSVAVRVHSPLQELQSI